MQLDILIPYNQQRPTVMKSIVEAISWPLGTEQVHDFQIVIDATSITVPGIKRSIQMVPGARFLAKNNTPELREANIRAIFINVINVQVPTTCTAVYSD